VPNARHTHTPAKTARHSGATQAFDGFHLASRPKALDGL